MYKDMIDTIGFVEQATTPSWARPWSASWAASGRTLS